MDTNSMWQKCPVCDGRGTVMNPLSYSGSLVCHVCNGHGIISIISGLLLLTKNLQQQQTQHQTQ